MHDLVYTCRLAIVLIPQRILPCENMDNHSKARSITKTIELHNNYCCEKDNNLWAVLG